MAGRSWPVTSEAELAACYDATFDEVFHYAARLTADLRRAEDLVSEAYTRLVHAGQGGDVTAVGVGWLITSVRRRFIDVLRSERREERRLRLVKPRGDEPAPAASSDLTDGLLASLSDRERAAVVLRYVEDLSVADVARSLSISVRATESLLARARARVRDTEVRDA